MFDNIIQIKEKIKENAQRVKELGNWPEHISLDSLIDRVPEIDKPAPGFDAGIACALDLIPRNKQKLSAILHAAYTPESINKVREEIAKIKNLYELLKEARCYSLDEFDRRFKALETSWWLLGCAQCHEGESYIEDLISDIKSFEDKKKRHNFPHVISQEISKIERSFFVVDNIPYAIIDGGMQGAYISGYPFAVGAGYGVWFVGTFYDSLGIPDDFCWSEKVDEDGRACSGPVHGSRQFVKCADLNELTKIVKFARVHLKY